ncbi:MAG: hypothetical protein HeimC3_41850 [Candidatus Heimdallarchaeota archaeon LC_3]|nr:MAG: hypothetical protein HeimC3_41850 [Candidatus Heimdallarchaeota archaeon LC_3]
MIQELGSGLIKFIKFGTNNLPIQEFLNLDNFKSIDPIVLSNTLVQDGIFETKFKIDEVEITRTIEFASSLKHFEGPKIKVKLRVKSNKPDILFWRLNIPHIDNITTRIDKEISSSIHCPPGNKELLNNVDELRLEWYYL